jgi:two-component system response regulator CpxR
MERVLVIDNDVASCDMLAEYLGAEGFLVECVQDGEAGLERSNEDNFDLIILDAVLPTASGLDVLRRLRARVFTPVIMVTARGEQVDRIVGLEIGADDYLSKPFNPRELLARMRAILRRTRYGKAMAAASPPGNRTLKLGDIELDTGTRLVYRVGERVDLTAVEFTLLETLVRRAGRLIPRDELIRAVLGRSPYPYDRSIDVHISRLRKKLGREAFGMERIRTIRNVGYLYVLPPAGPTVGNG